jgi:hypothetical protein
VVRGWLCEDGKYVFIEDDRGEIGCLDASPVLSAMTQTSEVLMWAAGVGYLADEDLLFGDGLCGDFGSLARRVGVLLWRNRMSTCGMLSYRAVDKLLCQFAQSHHI